MLVIQKYSQKECCIWDNFVRNAVNSHFMFYRDYIEYHSDRFIDYSLLFYKDNKLIALMPANIYGNVLYSHQGLTFGGIIHNVYLSAPLMLDIFKELISYLREMRLSSLVYKCVPYIYYERHSQEDLYALFRNGGNLIRRDVSSAIDLSRYFKYAKGKKYNIARARKKNIEICEMNDYTEFWNLLSVVLSEYHNASPVHSVAEIDLLHNRFPENIKLFVARENNELLAGVVIYENKDVVHTQYLASSHNGRMIGALDLLIDHLIKTVYYDKKYFDFGTSNANEGKGLNYGLIGYKERFGATGVVHDFYELLL